MQVIFTVLLTLAFGFSLLQCQKANTVVNANIAKANMNSSVTPANTPQPEDAPRISLADAKKDFDAGTAIFIDTRAAESYKVEHIKGSINIPAGDFETRYTELPKDKKIIAYCS